MKMNFATPSIVCLLVLSALVPPGFSQQESDPKTSASSSAEPETAPSGSGGLRTSIAGASDPKTKVPGTSDPKTGVPSNSEPVVNSGTNNGAMKTSGGSASLAKKMSGFLLGAVAGVPACVVRKPIDEQKFGAEQLACGSVQPRVKVPAAIFYMPFAIVSGVCEAPLSSVKHSWQSFDDPFSKEQFSLREKVEKEEKEPNYGDYSR